MKGRTVQQDRKLTWCYPWAISYIASRANLSSYFLISTQSISQSSGSCPDKCKCISLRLTHCAEASVQRRNRDCYKRWKLSRPCLLKWLAQSQWLYRTAVQIRAIWVDVWSFKTNLTTPKRDTKVSERSVCVPAVDLRLSLLLIENPCKNWALHFVVRSLTL